MSYLKALSAFETTGSQFHSAAAKADGKVYLHSAAGSLFELDLVTGEFLRTVATGLTTTSADMCIVNNASAFIAASTPQLIELSSGYVQSLTGGGTGPAVTQRHHQCAWNGSNLVFYSNSGSPGAGLNFKLANLSTMSVTVSSVTYHDTFPSACNVVIADKDQPNFLYLGDSIGYVVCPASSSFFRLPIGPVAVGTTTIVSDLSKQSNVLLASDYVGFTYLYDYRTSNPTVKSTNFIHSNGSFFPAGGNLISNIASSMYLSSASQTPNTEIDVALYDINNFRINLSNSYLMSAVAKCFGLYLDSSLKRGYILTTNTLTIVETNDQSLTGVQTRSQEPAGTDSGGRIIRIKDYGPGKSVIVLDSLIGAGASSIKSQKDGNYLEIFLNDPPTKGDWRRFNI